MADPTPSIETADAACWQCGAPASAKYAYGIQLVANPRRALDAFGYPVERGRWQDMLKVRVPRCANCRYRNRLSAVIVLGSAIVGAIVAPIVPSSYWPQIHMPAWLFPNISHEGTGDAATGIGIVLGLAAGMLGVALHRRLSGFRSLNTCPPVVRLRRAGWYYPD